MAPQPQNPHDKNHGIWCAVKCVLSSSHAAAVARADIAEREAGMNAFLNTNRQNPGVQRMGTVASPSNWEGLGRGMGYYGQGGRGTYHRNDSRYSWTSDEESMPGSDGRRRESLLRHSVPQEPDYPQQPDYRQSSNGAYTAERPRYGRIQSTEAGRPGYGPAPTSSGSSERENLIDYHGGGPAADRAVVGRSLPPLPTERESFMGQPGYRGGRGEGIPGDQMEMNDFSARPRPANGGDVPRRANGKVVRFAEE
ncbi:hypothetical protein EDC01DRAFT_753656 [Geopyxis carbonaria]|nr:hypothetical protein EDC01DRAFT_753656 [Geopyxis carbonaria]